MTNVTEYNGLCITCNYGPTCVRRQHHGKPVWYCEEFDDYMPSPSKAVISNSILMPDISLDKPQVKEESAEYSGLCVNCDNRRICALLKPESEVLQCNEYI